MTTRDEILSIQRELNLTDVDMCNFMCLTMDEFNAFVRGEYKLTTVNLVLWIMAVEMPLESLLPRPEYAWVPMADHRE